MKKICYLLSFALLTLLIAACSQATPPSADTYTVTFNANEGMGEMTPQIFTQGISKSLSLNTFRRENYFFKGWATTEYGIVVYADEAFYTATRDTTLYAVWDAEYSLSSEFTIENGVIKDYSGSDTDVRIPPTINGVKVTGIGKKAFEYRTNLTSITIPEGVTSIGDAAFRGCSGLISITFPSSVKTIEYSAFSYCSGLTSITLPSSVTSIGDYAFNYCSGLTSVNFPSSVKTIGYSAFSYCSGLTSINFPSSVTSIGDYAFSHCRDLTSVNFPSSITSIGDAAFRGCSGLTSITVDSGNTNYESDNGVLFSKGKLELLLYPDNKEDSKFEVPSSVTTIGYRAFDDCTTLTSITLPDGVTTIEDESFYMCTNLTTINIPESVTIIREETFDSCTSLTSITLPDGVTTIEDESFYMCTNLTTINIPDNVKTIGKKAFGGCEKLAAVHTNYTKNADGSKPYPPYNSSLGEGWNPKDNGYFFGAIWETIP